jgi:hypothetical protein
MGGKKETWPTKDRCQVGRMFGLIKRKQYAADVEVFLMAMFGAGDEGATLAKVLKDRYSDYWDDVIKDGLELGNSPELTGAALSSIFYQDMFLNEISPDDVLIMRKAIVAQDHSDDPGFPSSLIFSALAMSVADDKTMPADFRTAWFRDIHRAIFGEDDTHLEDTVTYLIDRANKLRATYKDLQADAYRSRR